MPITKRSNKTTSAGGGGGNINKRQRRLDFGIVGSSSSSTTRGSRADKKNIQKQQQENEEGNAGCRLVATTTATSVSGAGSIINPYVISPADPDTKNATTTSSSMTTPGVAVTASSMSSSSAKRSLAFVSPDTVTTTTTPVRSEEDFDDIDEHEAESSFVPRYLHRNVQYATKGKAELATTTQKVYKLIRLHYIVPSDLEQSRSKYGPLSGTCYEERVIQEYSLGNLKMKRNAGPESAQEDREDVAVQICTSCAETGHLRDECPTLI